MAADLLYKSVPGLCLIISRAARYLPMPALNNILSLLCRLWSLWLRYIWFLSKLGNHFKVKLGLHLVVGSIANLYLVVVSVANLYLVVGSIANLYLVVGSIANLYWTLNYTGCVLIDLLLKMGQCWPLFVYFCLFNISQFKFKLTKAWMVCLGFEPWAVKWKAQTNPLSYGGTPIDLLLIGNCNTNCLAFPSPIIFRSQKCRKVPNFKKLKRK